MTVPPYISPPKIIVYLTGVIEIVLALLLTIGVYRKHVSTLIISFLILILPSNVYAAVHEIDIQNATYNGPGLSYLFFRIPLQLLFIAWIYVFSIRDAGKQRNASK